jgi:plastocyanin
LVIPECATLLSKGVFIHRDRRYRRVHSDRNRVAYATAIPIARMDRRTFLATGLGTVAATALAGCTAGGSASADDYDVGMSTVDFRPSSLTVTVGETVVWRNTSKQGHTVTAYEDGLPEEAEFFATGGFDSQSAAEDGWTSATDGRLAAGREFEHTFDVPGEYGYYCIPHEPSGMVGTVTVTGSGANE